MFISHYDIQDKNFYCVIHPFQVMCCLPQIYTKCHLLMVPYVLCWAAGRRKTYQSCFSIQVVLEFGVGNLILTVNPFLNQKFFTMSSVSPEFQIMRAMTFSSPLPPETLLVHPHSYTALEERNSFSQFKFCSNFTQAVLWSMGIAFMELMFPSRTSYP